MLLSLQLVRLFYKLAMALSSVALVPIAVFGLLGFGRAREALRVRIEQEQALLAQQASDIAELRIRAIVDLLRQNARLANYGTEHSEVLTGLLRVVYHQSDDITIVSLINDQSEAIVPSVYLENPGSIEALERHRPATDSDLAEHGRHIPLEAALASGAAVGPLYGDEGRPRIAIAVVTPHRREDRHLVLVAEISLEALEERLRGLGGVSAQVTLVRPNCRTVLDNRGPLVLPHHVCGSDIPLPEDIRTGRITIDGRGNGAVGAFAPVPLLGLGVIVSRAESTALEPLNRLRDQSAFWAAIGVLLALLLAGLVARDLSSRIEELDSHALALAKGDLEFRTPVHSSDELGRLAQAFNNSARELSHQRKKIEAQNKEIRAWNEELEKRVAEKTDQLAKAQEIVLRSRRLAGLGVLGAGVAHEVNNPLASSLGFVQLVLRDQELSETHRQFLKEAEKSSLRIREIVEELRKLADGESSPEFVDVDLCDTAAKAAQIFQAQLEEDGIVLELESDSTVLKIRGSQGQLIEALLHLLHNARQAISGEGRITLRVSEIGGQLATVTVADTGSGIPQDLLDRVFDPFFTTKASWEARGLGLSIVHKIAEEHSATLELTSEVGHGTVVTLTLPIVTAHRHIE